MSLPIDLNSLPKDYNDEAYRTRLISKKISDEIQIFPTVISELITQYIVLLNINFAKQFKTVLEVIFSQKKNVSFGPLVNYVNKYDHISGFTTVIASHPLSCLIPFWTIEIKDHQEWSAGLYHPKTQTTLEICSECPEFEPKKKATMLYYGKYVDSKKARIHNFKLRKFNSAGSLLKFKVDLEKSCVYVNAIQGNSDSDEDIEYNKSCSCSCTPKLIWSNIIENLSEFIPFFRFTELRSSTGFRVVR